MLGFPRPRVLSRHPQCRPLVSVAHVTQAVNETKALHRAPAVGYPMMELYPEVNTDPTSSPSVGLLQPNGSMTSLNQ